MRAITAVTAVMIAAAWASPPTLVDEDFGSAQFPPAGWDTEGQTGWSWTNAGGYACGNLALAPFSSSWTALKTFTFSVSDQTPLSLSFRYYTDGYTEIGRQVYVGGWSQAVPYTYPHDWRSFEATTPALAAGTYRLRFYMAGSGGSHGLSGVWFVDDVLLTRNNVGVAASSLGRVKALYR